MKEVITLLITSVVAILASSGFWSYKIKKLEHSYEMDTTTKKLEAKLDKLLESQMDMSKKLDKLAEDQKRTNDVTMAVARDRIYYLCKAWLDAGDFSDDNMRDIKALLTPYQNNGGNGIAQEYYDKYEHLYKNSGVN